MTSKFVVLLFFVIAEASYILYNRCNRGHFDFPQVFSNISSISEIGEGRRHYELRIKNSNIPTIPRGAFEMYNTTCVFFLSGLHIKNISVGAFSNLKYLRELHFESNDLEELGVGVFEPLKSLEALYLSDNRISIIDNRVFALNSLQRLYLNGNRISKIDNGTLSGLRNLEVLVLSGNRIMSINMDYILTDNNLYNLDLSKNPLIDIIIRKKMKLNALILDETPLRKFPSDLSTLSNDVMYITRGKLEEVDCALLPSVSKTLNLSKNKISSIINLDLLSAEEINLSANNLSSINQSFASNIVKICLNFNQIGIIDQIFLQSEAVEYLDLSFNQISTITRRAFRALSSLKELYLNENRITYLEPTLFGNLINLEKLNLSNKLIEKFELNTFNSLQKLAFFDVSGNRLKSLQDTLHPLLNLDTLYMDRNKVSEMDGRDFLSHLKKLRVISLDKNQFSCQLLKKTERFLNEKNVKMLQGTTFYLRNFHEIGCKDSRDYEVRIPVHILQKVINDSIENSKLESFFNLKENYSQYFSNYIDGGNSNGDVNSLIQICAFSFIFVIIFFLIVYVRKMEEVNLRQINIL